MTELPAILMARLEQDALRVGRPAMRGFRSAVGSEAHGATTVYPDDEEIGAGVPQTSSEGDPFYYTP